MKRPGFELVMVIVFLSILAIIGMAVLQYLSVEHKRTNVLTRNEQAITIAEAGVTYYRWHLAHYPTDFQDGTNAAGPYIHDYLDADGKTIGKYELTITPPTLGNTITTVRSVGYLLSDPNQKRTITVRLGIPSLTKFAVVANADMRFGTGTETFGPVHSNGGIRFDGVAHGLVTSARICYDDPDHSGAQEFAVHTHSGSTDPLPGAAFCASNPPPSGIVPDRLDVFAGGRTFPSATVDFTSITTDLATLKTASQTSSGIYLAPSGGRGYHLTLRTDGKVDMRIVNSEVRCQYRNGGSWYDYGYCSNNFNTTCTQNSTCGSGNTCIQSSHSIGTAAGSQSTFTYNGVSSLGVTLPANGIIFVSDDLWIDGQVDNARVTVVAAKDPISTGLANIYLADNLRYTNTNGADAIGLIAQQDILASYFSKNTMQIDAALIAQKGRIGRPYFGSNFTSSTNSSNFRLQPSGSSLPNGGGSENSCDDFRVRSTLTTLGSLATNQRYGFAWVGTDFSCGGGDSNDSGYCDRNLNFDANLTFGPPPSFPTTGEYSVISFTQE